MPSRRFVFLLTIILVVGHTTWAQRTSDRSDLAVVHRIRQEATQKSQVMEHLFYLTDVHGPRLSNSPGFLSAAKWVVERTKLLGLKNVAMEKWGPFGRGWSQSRFSAHLVEPGYAPLIGTPLPWTLGTNGVVSGTPILAVLRTERDVNRYRATLEEFFAQHQGKLRGKIILIREPRKLKPQDEVASRRLTATELQERAAAIEPLEPISIDVNNPAIPLDPEERRRFNAFAPRYILERFRVQREALQHRLNRYLVDEGVRLVVYPASFGDGGTVFPPTGGSAYKSGAPAPPPSIALTPEHYNRIARLIEKKLPVRIEVEVQAHFHEDTEDSINVVAEIPGRSKRDEVVMIGGHLDSWHVGTGATDNAAGCAVMIEVLRIIKALDLKMERTVRMVLWGGEEQGLLGSRAYAKEHFADIETMQLKPGAQQGVGVFQPGQRDWQNTRGLSPGQRHGPADL